ncbi:MAG: hypothetical protein KC731_26725 [Myxococcales bacterium]|nr:hypothetical protein [Myxococcales bacterium]
MTKGDNDNTKLEIEVKNLALPSRVVSGTTTYVVWLQPDGETAMQNVGGLKVDEDLVGTLDTLTPYTAFVVLVTPEVSAQVTAPTNKAVFTSRVESAD